jgi:hypothetical protein
VRASRGSRSPIPHPLQFSRLSGFALQVSASGGGFPLKSLTRWMAQRDLFGIAPQQSSLLFHFILAKFVHKNYIYNLSKKTTIYLLTDEDTN